LRVKIAVAFPWMARLATPVRTDGLRAFRRVPILALNRRSIEAANGAVFSYEADTAPNAKRIGPPSVEETKQFPAIERRRNQGFPRGNDAKQERSRSSKELGKALTSSLQLDQVLRTIMEKIDEFLRPDNWSLLLLDEAKQELYFELAVGTASTALKDVRVKMGQGIAGWVAPMARR